MFVGSLVVHYLVAELVAEPVVVEPVVGPTGCTDTAEQRWDQCSPCNIGCSDFVVWGCRDWHTDFVRSSVLTCSSGCLLMFRQDLFVQRSD